jgi:pimeloyl-ACP methyl ester carboxylesterase
MSLYVLIHGNWHDGSAWANVIKRLEHQGHAAFGPTLPGHGKDVPRQVSHAQCTQSVVDFILDKDLTDIVLVGHSYGGTIISKVVEALTDRVRRLVFLSGVVLEDGESLMDAGPPHYRRIFDELAAASQDNTVTVPFEVWCETFINDADPALAKTAYAQLAPEGYAQMLEPVDMKRFYTLDTPRSYILATEDIVFPSGEWGWHPRITSRLGPHRLLEMPGSHEVLFTSPDGLADKIIEAGRD